jgi:MoaA/NifB/PqqE/SkfB family radical SAM enzyme
MVRYCMAAGLDFARTFGTYLLQRNLQHLIIHVTNHCNFRCEHCFIDFSPKRDLKLPQFQEIARQVGPLFWLDIAGGEPSLRKDLADIVAAFDAKVVQIPSNGSLPDLLVPALQRIKTLTKAEVAVSFSLDGLPETHGKVRGAPKNWQQVWDCYEKVRAVGGIAVKMNTCLTNRNVDEIIPLMKLVRERGVDFHSIILLRGDPIDPSVTLPPVDVLERLAPAMFEILGTYDYGRNFIAARVLRNYHKLLWKTSLRTIEEQRQVTPCYAGKFHMVMMGDGRVSSCEMLDAVGNVTTQSWTEIMQGQAYREQVASIERGECHCTHNCAMMGSLLFNPKHAAKLAFGVDIPNPAKAAV